MVKRVADQARGTGAVRGGKRPADAGRIDGRAIVLVDASLLSLATEGTGLSDPAAVIEFALRLLTQADPSAEYARQSRGALPGFDLDI